MSRSRPRSAIQLDVLLEDERDSTPAHIADAAEKSFDAIPGGKLIPLDRIDTWERQPRKSFDEEGIAELAASIAGSGVLEPLVVRRYAAQSGRYIIIAGHRRLLAARRVHGSEDAGERARVEALPCVIREATDDSAFADALVENLVRKDLTRREMMDAVKVLNDEYGWSVRAIARRTGRSHHDLSVLLRIAGDEELSGLVADDVISSTALGVLVEEKHRTVRGAVVAGIKAGSIKTVGEVEEAVKAAHAAREAAIQPAPVGDITQPVEPDSAPDDGAYDPRGVGDITHPYAPHHEPQDRPRGRGGVSDITHPATLPAVVTDDAVRPERPRGGEPAPEGAIPGRTIPVQAHERRIGGVDDPLSHFERVLTGSLAEIRACVPLTAADKAKGRAFAAEVLALIDATEE